jgi:hypothetical protein
VYYTKDGKTFSNRVEAITYANKTEQIPYINYYDKIYSRIDWSIEPEGTLDFHYKMQARRIRDEYDYVILCYSGGFDSTNILETFHFNNIKLDKIVVTGPFKQDSYSGSDENHNGEIYENAFPYLTQLGLDPIVQVIDYTDLYENVNQFSVYDFGEQWVEEIGCRYSPHHFFWRDLDRYVVPPQYQDKKVAIIWGTDKPRLNGNTFQFLDNAITSYARFNQNPRHNVTNINFYWDPNYPLILLKQLHTLKKYQRFLTNEEIARIIYRLKQPLNFKSGKSPSLLIAKRDTFLLNKTDSSIYDFYQMGVNRLGASVQTNIKSKPYYIQ